MAGKAPDQPERYRVILNDMDNFIQSMLASSMFPLVVFHCFQVNESPELNYLVTDGILKKGHIVRLTDFQPTTVKDKR